MTIKKKVGQLIHKHGTNDPFEIAGLMDITVIFEPLGNSLGYFSKFNRTSIIHINESLPYKEQLSTCAHELGHAILHPDVNTAFLKTNTFYPTNKIEREANEFMLELLFNQGNEIITVHEATEQYDVSEQLLTKFFYP